MPHVPPPLMQPHLASGKPAEVKYIRGSTMLRNVNEVDHVPRGRKQPVGKLAEAKFGSPN